MPIKFKKTDATDCLSDRRWYAVSQIANIVFTAGTRRGWKRSRYVPRDLGGHPIRPRTGRDLKTSRANFTITTEGRR